MKNINEFKECPFCGSESYYMKQSYKGTCYYYINFDGSDADNTETHGGAEYKNTSKFAFCSECNKKIGLLEDGE